MSQQIHNPFSPASSNPNGSSHGDFAPQSQPKSSGNPFQALEQAAAARSPFAAADGDFSPRTEGGQNERSVKLPEPRPRDGGEQRTESATLNPFELVETNPSQPSSEQAQPFQPGPVGFPAQPMPTPQPQFSMPPQAESDNAARAWDQAPQNFSQPSQNVPAQQRASWGSSIRQLELRAIFGVNHELCADEIIQRARTLPGVRNLALIDDHGANAVSQLREHVARLGFGDRDSLYLASSSGNIDFMEENGATLAVLYEGNFAPGVRETLIIVTRELAKLS